MRWSGGRSGRFICTGARGTVVDLYEEKTVLEWVRQLPNLRFTAVLSEASTEEVEHEHRRTGWVHDAVLADYPNLGIVRCVCGRAAGDDRSDPGDVSGSGAHARIGCTSIRSTTHRVQRPSIAGRLRALTRRAAEKGAFSLPS